MNKKSVILFLLPGFLLAACVPTPLLTQLLQQSTPSPQPNVAFMDDFSNTKSGWNRLESALGKTDYTRGTYQILVSAPSTDLFANPNLSFKDAVIEVTATRLDGPDSNNFGVICRYKDEKNFYAAQISSSGYAGIFRMKNGVYKLLGSNQMLPAPSVLGGSGANHIRFVCVGTTLKLEVNNELVDQREDSSFEFGDVGLIAGTYDQPGVLIAFDDFVVAQP